MIPALAVAAALALGEPACALDLPPAEHPMALETSGVRWYFPFDHALAVAREERRMLLMKPVAFGTTREAFW